MEFIQSILQQSLSFIVPLIILLGALIFVHELGHFLVAKYFGVRVEVFSLGFGKKLLQYKRGDTTYCISLIPFGGYVKMYGENPAEEISDEDRKVSFLHKPVGQRIAIVLAGPLMNLIFAFILFFAIAFIGDHKPLAIVGQVQPYTPAAEAGLKAGDEILSINSSAVKNWEDVRNQIEQAPSNEVGLTYKPYRENDIKSVRLPLKTIENPNILSLKENIRTIEGLEIYAVGTSIGVGNPESIAYQTGLRTGDRILSINDQSLSRWYEISEALPSDASPISIEVERRLNEDEKIEKLSFTIPLEKSVNDIAELGIEKADLYVGLVSEDSAAKAAGIQVGDKFLTINGKALHHWIDLINAVTSYKKENGPLQITVLRNGKTIELETSPTMLAQENPLTGKTEESLKLGVGPVMTMAAPITKGFPVDSFSAGITSGLDETKNWVVATAVGFVRLFQNKVSTKSIGGPIMIGQIASESFKVGLVPFLKIMAIISINLFLINLLPIPVLDGGHLVLFSIEAIKGAPVSMHKVAIAQQIGFFILLFLMMFAMFNDISRVLGS